MKNINKKWFTLSLVTAAIAAATTGCKDDHFDISPEVNGRMTIWENINSREDLTEYADILQNVKYSKSEEATTEETYASLLNGDQTFTVWAPENGTFNYSYYLNLIKSGNRDSIYKVEKELIRNNMTRFSHVVNGNDSIKLLMFNSKSAWLNNAKGTIKGNTMTEKNIGALNGILHVTQGATAYQPNMYEFFSSRPGILDSVNVFVRNFQKNEFDENQSTKGPTVNGAITWVDSITHIRNTFTEDYLNAYLTSEDSNYVMILPSNTAWNEALNKTKSLYNYKNSYKQDINTQTEAGADTVISGAETKFSDLEKDSIANFRSKCAIMQHLAFNANWQAQQIPITNINDIKAIDIKKDSLISTTRVKYKKTGTLNSTNDDKTMEVDNFAEMFGNKNPIETSNGYAYIVDDYKMPSTVYAPNIDKNAALALESVDKNTNANYQTTTYTKVYRYRETDTLAIDTTFRVNYVCLTNKAASSQPTGFFKVTDVLSCKYDIFVVMAFNSSYGLQNRFQAFIAYDTEAKRIAKEALKNPDEDAVDVEGKSLTGSNAYVNCRPYFDENGLYQVYDTICIARDFEFPVCYEGLTNAYPVIQITSQFSSSQKQYYAREMRVNAIILKPKFGDALTEE